MVLRELMSPRRLRPNDAAGEIDILRTLAMAGISGGKALMKTGREWSMMKQDTKMEGVAGAALYLLSDLVFSCTGETLHVDAGFHAVAVPSMDED